MTEVEAFLGVGSNIEPQTNIPDSLERLQKDLVLTALSTFYRTPPLGDTAQPEFINGVVKVMTTLSPRTLKFDVLRRIEKELGRQRTENRNAPRTIDLDILIFQDLICQESDLQIPDPAITDRSFLALPLAELAPHAMLPGTQESFLSLSQKMSTPNMVPLPEFTNSLRQRFERKV